MVSSPGWCQPVCPLASQLPCLYSSKNYDTSSLVPLSSLPNFQFLPLLPLRVWAVVSQTHCFLEMMEEIGILLLSPNGSQWGWFCSPGDSWLCLDMFLVAKTWEAGATGILEIEARDATKYSIMHRTVSTTKNNPVQNVRSAKVDNPVTIHSRRTDNICLCLTLWLRLDSLNHVCVQDTLETGW